MEAIVLTVIVDEKRRIMIDLPDDTPTGPVELVIRPLAPPTPQAGADLTREAMRAKLAAAGLVTPGMRYAPADAVALSAEEEEQLGRLLAVGKSAADIIDEEREERF